MATLRDIKRRINSVKNTRKITRAMKLVAGAKMRKAQQAAESAQPYQQTLRKILGRVILAEDSIEHDLLITPENDKDIVLIAISSDRGLCAGFNNQIIKHLNKEIKHYKGEGKNVHLMLYGRKIVAACKKDKSLSILFSHTGAAPATFDELAKDLASRLTERLIDKKMAMAKICYNEFESVMTQSPISQQVLPMKLEQSEEVEYVDYIFEPGAEEILGALLPMSLQSQLLQAFLDTEAGEQAARMQAMDNATRNAGEMIDKLSLEYNRARQAAITTELIEIISGAEAL
jgi:F-type H+-transporting ATPase subunit gamma